MGRRSSWAGRWRKASPFRARSRPIGARRAAARARQLPPGAFVAFIQNHDQIGNRAFGERLDALAPAAVVRALASVYLLLPQTPMLFMGEEWAAAQPFPFFCDFDGDLAEAVRADVARNSRASRSSRSPSGSEIPDPVAEATFLSAKLDWSRIDADRLGFYRAALAARREHVRPLLPKIERGGAFEIRRRAGGPSRLASRRPAPDARRQSFRRSGRLSRERPESSGAAARPMREFGPWSVRWSVEPA